MEPEDLTVIGHTGDLLVDIYTAKYGAYLHFTAVLNNGGEGAQFRRNGCSICAVEVRNLTRNTHQFLDLPLDNFLIQLYNFLGHSLLSPFRMMCGNFILPEPASYVVFFALFNLRNLLYIISAPVSAQINTIHVNIRIFAAL